eukprot:PLAT15471.3.p2 GENE.PLAT15471.3~~PLAT15471.3.p2  ORF type:complete len:116 (+),score=40.88 PLAT15471.3:132-479(+)
MLVGTKHDLADDDECQILGLDEFDEEAGTVEREAKEMDVEAAETSWSYGRGEAVTAMVGLAGYVKTSVKDEGGMSVDNAVVKAIQIAQEYAERPKTTADWLAVQAIAVMEACVVQ